MVDPVEITTRYVTTVDTLPEAWAFVMDRIDSVGPHPHVRIKPISTVGVSDMIDAFDGHESGNEWHRRFEVAIEGTVDDHGASATGAGE